LIKSTFVSGYLDDVGIGGDVQSVVEDIQLVEFEATRLGLRLNHSKCEIVGLDISSRVTLTRAGLCFQECLPSSATLLGTPIHVDGIDRAIRDRLASLELAVPRLKKLSSHEALFLLRNSLAMPKLQYLLRTAPCFLSTVTSEFDDVVARTLSTCLNVQISQDSRLQLSLPVRWGGLGIRSASFVASSAFLSSLSASNPLLLQHLPSEILSLPDSLHADALVHWRADMQVAPPCG